MNYKYLFTFFFLEPVVFILLIKLRLCACLFKALIPLASHTHFTTSADTNNKMW